MTVYSEQTLKAETQQQEKNMALSVLIYFLFGVSLEVYTR